MLLLESKTNKIEKYKSKALIYDINLANCTVGKA